MPLSRHPLLRDLGQHVVHMQTRLVGDVGSAETEPWPQMWSPEGSAPALVTHMAPTQTSGPSGADSPFVAGWTTDARIDSVAVAPTDVNTIYATAGGRFFVTANRGSSWVERNPVASPPATVEWKDIVVDPTSAQVAYVVAANYSSDIPGGGHVFQLGGHQIHFGQLPLALGRLGDHVHLAA